MEFVGIDAYDWAWGSVLGKVILEDLSSEGMRLTISFVQFRNLECVSTALDDVVVELVPESQGSELGAGEFSERIEVKSVDSKSQLVEKIDTAQEESILQSEKLHRLL